MPEHSPTSWEAELEELRRRTELAHAMGGADISFFVGLPVAGILYWVFAQSIDVDAETRVAEQEAAEVERLAQAHDRP